MPIIKIYNNDTNRIETYFRCDGETMPYITGNTLTVREFRGTSRSDILWTEKRAMQAWNRFRSSYGKPIRVGSGFRRPFEGGHSQQSQHYAGVAFDVGQNLCNTERLHMRRHANHSRILSFVDHVLNTPSWVHFDNRRGKSACKTGGYPMVRHGSRGVYVFVLQDVLRHLCYDVGELDGIFDNKTAHAVKAYQRKRGLVVDCVVDCETWSNLMCDVVCRC
ncbi:MAG: peptidoglycan-binding protein [Oscillospiraceae bacterium]|nr:peptidoglycan-binding protein [Oscillospiraceae bacterium]